MPGLQCAEAVELPRRDRRAVVINGKGDRIRRSPRVGIRIVNLDRGRRIAIDVVTSDDIDFSVQDSSREFLPLGRHRGKCLPGAAALRGNRDNEGKRPKQDGCTNVQVV